MHFTLNQLNVFLRVVHTLSNGRFALRDGKLQDDAVGTGRYVKRVLA